MTNLVASQSFANDMSSTRMRIDGTTKTGISGTAGKATLNISYDAGTQRYSLSAAGLTQTFDSSQITVNDATETRYQPSGGSSLERLTVVKTSYSGQPARQYVRLGYWQRNATDSSGVDLNLITFTYGLPTLALAVPRTGTAGYNIDVFGAASAPGKAPLAFQGSGTFSVDFAAGVFAARASTTEYELVTGAGTVGGGLDITAAGYLSSSDGTFSGNALYQGTLGFAGGTINGRFYGPTGSELGAAFSASNASTGLSAAGAFTGVLDATLKPDNLTLTNMTKQQLFYTQWGWNSVSQLNWQNGETFTASPPTSNLYGGQFTIADKVTGGDPNYIVYRKTFTGTGDTQDVTLKLYKPGVANTELVLTYATFGEWKTVEHAGVNNYPVDQFFFYGLETPARLLVGKTGSAHYQGIVHGNASNINNGQNDPLTGTSTIDVDFGTQVLSGSLTLVAKPTAGGSIDYGRFDFSGSMPPYLATTTIDFSRADQSYGHWDSRFFGPDGEEIAAKFNVNVPAGSYGAASSLSGVALAKKQ